MRRLVLLAAGLLVAISAIGMTVAAAAGLLGYRDWWPAMLTAIFVGIFALALLGWAESIPRG